MNIGKLLDKYGYTEFSLERPEILKILRQVVKTHPDSKDKKYWVSDYNPVQSEYGSKFQEMKYLEDVENWHKSSITDIELALKESQPTKEGS